MYFSSDMTEAVLVSNYQGCSKRPSGLVGIPLLVAGGLVFGQRWWGVFVSGTGEWVWCVAVLWTTGCQLSPRLIMAQFRVGSFFGCDPIVCWVLPTDPLIELRYRIDGVLHYGRRY